MRFLPIGIALLTFVSTMGGGLIAARFRHKLGIVAAFASGVLIAVPLFDILPESFNLGSEVGVAPVSILYAVALGFIFLYVLERYFSVHHICEGDECQNVRHPRGGLYGAIELSVHSFMDGLAIGLSFHVNTHVGIIIAVAVISHDFSDGINTFTVMATAGNTVKNSLKMLLIDAAAPTLGAISTLFFMIPERWLVLILPFFAGGFLYLGASELLPEAHEKNPPIVSLIATLAGFALIFVITRFLNI